MAKIKVRSGRGTGTIEVDDDASKWSGSDFKKIQAARKEASKDKYVTVGRGTGKIKFGDIADTKSTDTKGMWVSSGRGTGRRQLKK
ncbi:hypothetical protein C6990_05580 [Nitrosopumilus sp. b3]|uniref:hypothetical protein n=1 Tax=Nitrosopumilus sp. b3 TaxID=2109909 RepID=UPI000A50FE85|nr:hypothetical protein [Nitrosopumilus sp. b3]KAF6247148.1 hypothetical protein C6990_05580 [Nitrosopumilus sp. b3]